MYNRRSKFDPLWNTVVVGGFEKGQPYVIFNCDIRIHTAVINKYLLTTLKLIQVMLLSYRFLGYVDKIGVAYEGDTIASGYGAYIALVIVITFQIGRN